MIVSCKGPYVSSVRASRIESIQITVFPTHPVTRVRKPPGVTPWDDRFTFNVCERTNPVRALIQISRMDVANGTTVGIDTRAGSLNRTSAVRRYRHPAPQYFVETSPVISPVLDRSRLLPNFTGFNHDEQSYFTPVHNSWKWDKTPALTRTTEC